MGTPAQNAANRVAQAARRNAVVAAVTAGKAAGVSPADAIKAIGLDPNNYIAADGSIFAMDALGLPYDKTPAAQQGIHGVEWTIQMANGGVPTAAASATVAAHAAAAGVKPAGLSTTAKVGLAAGGAAGLGLLGYLFFG